MDKNIRNSEDHSDRITCNNSTCQAKIEKSESEAKRFNGHFAKFMAIQNINEHIKHLVEVNTKLCELYKSDDLREKREALYDELEKIIDKSEDRRENNEEKAMAEINRLEEEIKKQKEINEKLSKPAQGRVSSPLYISDTEYDSPPDDSEEDSPDEEELKLMSKIKQEIIEDIPRIGPKSRRSRNNFFK
ncbi:unnamed protein product [Oikopleura dioica]|uniref:Uncharacterized protein n=1 Tax=Oikopleura dioica TaxID=34765 RepID=E4YCY8_OIKDI|nr:unnamed protein product [Oikopleura dioica]